MATEKRLIDANAMRQDWLENGENEFVYDTNAVLESIDAQPTVDAVEVVRCKDCVYGEYAGLGKFMCDLHELVGKGDFYCASGERKDNEM